MMYSIHGELHLNKVQFQNKIRSRTAQEKSHDGKGNQINSCLHRARICLFGGEISGGKKIIKDEKQDIVVLKPSITIKKKIGKI